MIPPHFYRQLYQRILQSKNIFLCSHKNCPDATAGLVAFIQICKLQQKSFYAFLETEVMDFLKTLHHIYEIKNQPPNLESYDLIIILDCSDLKHTGLFEQLSFIKIKNREQTYFINLDHHASNNFFADLNLVDKNASSVCELVYNFYQINKIEIDKEIARALLFGILSDTDYFLNAGTSQNSLSTASQLLAEGVDLTRTSKLLNKNNFAKIQLWSKVLSRLKINQKYNIAFTYLLQKDLIDIKADEDTIEAITNILNNLGDVKAVFLAKEQTDGSFKVSMRSTYPGIDLSYLAKIAGGGGHAKAAGFGVERFEFGLKCKI